MVQMVLRVSMGTPEVAKKETASRPWRDLVRVVSATSNRAA